VCATCVTLPRVAASSASAATDSADETSTARVCTWWLSPDSDPAAARSVDMPYTGDVAADLRAWLRGNANALAAPQNAALVRALAAAAADDPHAGEALYNQLTGPQHDAVVQRLQQGVDAGQVRVDTDVEAVADAIIGATLYRVLARPATRGETVQRFDGLIDALIAGVRP
jgi:Tetracyclin repressor-like, C-terminal domain